MQNVKDESLRGQAEARGSPQMQSLTLRLNGAEPYISNEHERTLWLLVGGLHFE